MEHPHPNFVYNNLISEANGIELMYSPAYLLKPRISIDGNKWCALYGENLQDGVAGFGDSPERAFADFNREWREQIRKGAKHE